MKRIRGTSELRPGWPAPVVVSEAARAARELFLGSPSEILARLLPEDPLAVRARVAACLEERALLLDAERVVLAAQVAIALGAARWRGTPELEDWLGERVDEALLVADERPDAEPPADDSLAPLAAPLALDARALSRACARFNRLPLEERRAFFALALDGAVPDRLARTRGLSLSELARRARRALALFRDAGIQASRGERSA